MDHSHKNYWKMTLLVLAVLLFSLSFRIDLNNEYPRGVDTYDLYSLSKDVQDRGYVVWNTEILTALGLTSFSYPSGGIVFLSDLSLVTGNNVMNAIFIWNFFLIMICGLLVYIILKRFFNDGLIPILSTLIYLNSRFLISYSTFFTARNILHVFFLAVLFLLIRGVDWKRFAIIGAIVIVSFFTHRATVLVGLLILAFIISRISFKFYKNDKMHNLLILSASIILFLATVFVVGHSNIGSDTTRLPFSLGNQYLNDLLRIIFSVSMHFGLLIVLLPLGYYFLLTKSNKSPDDFFILILFTLGCAFLVETVYFFYVFLPITVIVMSYFLEHLFKTDRKHVKAWSVVVIVLALIAPIFITVLESTSDISKVLPQTVSTAAYLDSEGINKSIACNNHVIYCSHMMALGSDIDSLTYTSGRMMIDRINITNKTVDLSNIRGKIVVRDNILGTALYADSYTTAIINWNTNPIILDKLVRFTNLGYIIDSNTADAIRNRAKITQKFGNMNTVYDNGLQQVEVV